MSVITRRGVKCDSLKLFNPETLKQTFSSFTTWNVKVFMLGSKSYLSEVRKQFKHLIDKQLLDEIAREMGLNRAFKKLYNLKNFNKTIYLKFKTWITEAIMLVL